MAEQPAGTGLTARALATASGTSEDVVGRLRDAGVITEEANGFAPASVGRVRLVVALETSGVSLETIIEAVRCGAFPLDFMDALIPEPVRLLPETHGEMLARLKIPDPLARPLRMLLGSAGAADDQQVRADDASLFARVPGVRALGSRDDQLARITRIVAQAMRRIVAAERDFIDEVLIGPAKEAGLGESEIMARISPARRGYHEAGLLLVTLLYQRFVDDELFQNLALHAERAIAAAGITERRPESPEAVAFVDVSGFTALAERQGDEAAVEAAEVVAELVQAAAVHAGGRLVKLLGDGAMLHFRSVSDGVGCVLALVEGAARSPIPPLHVGIAAGPIVHRDGDLFGSVVNIAALAADRAGAGEILATDQVRSSWAGDGVTFTSIDSVALKHVPRPLELFRLARSPDSGQGRSRSVERS